MSVVWACLLFVVLLVGWSLNVFGLPGNWINLAAVACYAYFMPADERVSISWWVVGAVLLLAIVGELVEGLAGAAGTATVGGSWRGAVLGILGSFVGAVLGAVVGLPIPVVGSVLGILLFACVGALAGAMVGERWKGRDWEKTWQVGQAAFWGRLLGTVSKLAIGSVMVAVVFAALVMK